MRLFEFILILEVSTFLLFILLNKQVLEKLILAGVLLIAFALHYILEGLRWQLYIVYLFLFLILIFHTDKMGKKVNGFQKFLLLLCILLTIASGFMAELAPVFHLPKAYATASVGTKNVFFKDATRMNRALKVKFWFPTVGNGLPDGVYSETPKATLEGLFGLPGFVFGHLRLVKTGTYQEAKAIKAKDRLPLIIYSHGSASTHLDNTALLQEIASNGYIVLAIDYNFSFEAYGLKKTSALTLKFETQKQFVADLIEKVVPNQVEDIRFVLDKIQDNNFYFANHINFNKIVLIGHSLGGTTAMDASLRLQGVQSIINMDGPINPKSIEQLQLPVLYMSSFSPDLPKKLLKTKGLPDIELYQDLKKWELQNVQRLGNQNTAGFHWVRFKNAGHLDFTDLPFMLPLMATNGYDKHKGHRQKSTIILDFLDAQLKGIDSHTKQNDTTLEWIKWIPFGKLPDFQNDTVPRSNRIGQTVFLPKKYLLRLVEGCF